MGRYNHNSNQHNNIKDKDDTIKSFDENSTNTSTKKDISNFKMNNISNTNLSMKKFIQGLVKITNSSAIPILGEAVAVPLDLDINSIPPLFSQINTQSSLLEKNINHIESVNHTTKRINNNYVIQYLNPSMKSNTKELCPPIPPNLGELFYLNLIVHII